MSRQGEGIIGESKACRVTEAGYVLKPDGFGYPIANEN